MAKMKKRTKIIIICTSLSLVLLISSLFFTSMGVYNYIFDVRCESDECLVFSLDDFPELQAEELEFDSQGEKLKGYFYTVDSVSPTALLIVAHGFGGGGHKNYLDVINYFAKNGFIVLGYDAHGNDESPSTVGGLPQGVIDLKSAITYAKNQESLKDLPLCLFGHSWGGYSCGAVLEVCDEVKAVCTIAAFDKSIDLMKAKAVSSAGAISLVGLPCLKLYENMKYSGWSNLSVSQGFEDSSAKVMVVQSKDDKTIPLELGYNIFYEKFSSSPRFKFVLKDEGGHSQLMYSQDAVQYIDEFNDLYAENYAKIENFTQQDRVDFFNEKFERDKWVNRLNLELFDEILNFYLDSVK